MPRVLAWMTAMAAVAFVVSPAFVSQFNGFDPGQFPVPQDDPAVQPAGYAFSIWGLIYAWLIVGTFYGVLKRSQDPAWTNHRLPLFLSLAVGTFWLAIAVWSPVAATLVIWAMLATALWALLATTPQDRWLQQAPVAIYAGWLTAASSVSIGLLLAGYGWTGETPAALVSLVIALALALGMQASLPRAPEYGLTVIWALIAVIVANASPLNGAVAGLAGLGVLALAGMLWRQRGR